MNKKTIMYLAIIAGIIYIAKQAGANVKQNLEARTAQLKTIAD